MIGAALCVGVLICSYRRADSLLRGLLVSTAQKHRPDDVVIMLRAIDHESRERAPDLLPLRVLMVTLPGTVQALNTGLDACRTHLLATTDGDTVPHPNWLARTHNRFADDPGLAGLGRDCCHDGERCDDRSVPIVRRIAYYGGAVSNHHVVAGELRDVERLNGANMSYRATGFATVRFDGRLRGQGAQSFEDAGVALAVGRGGWRLRYDPDILVGHYTAELDNVRHYSLASPVIDLEGLRNYAYKCFFYLPRPFCCAV